MAGAYLIWVVLTAVLAECVVDPSPEEAQQFIEEVYNEMGDLLDEYNTVEWEYRVVPNDKAEPVKKRYDEIDKKVGKFQTEKYHKLITFPWQSYDEPLRRKFFALFTILHDKAMPDEKSILELINSKIKIRNERVAKKIKEFNSQDESKLLSYADVEKKLKDSNPGTEELNHYWREIHDKVAKELKNPFTHVIDLENKNADKNRFRNMAQLHQAIWEIDDFENTVNRLYNEIKPFYDQLHAYVRHRLWKNNNQDNNIVDLNGPIPASLLGYTWADARGIYKQVAAYPKTPLLDVTQAIVDNNIPVDAIARAAEGFYKSLGFEPFGDDFFQNSVFQKNSNVYCDPLVRAFKPKDSSDLKYRLLVCAENNQDGHTLLHSWFGYVAYLKQATQQPTLFRHFPNMAFDYAYQNVMRKFSMAPEYLKSISPQVLDPNFQPSHELKINTLLQEALEKVFYLPFALAWEQWRWQVAREEIKPEHYNCEYWKLRTKIQGVAPPVERSEAYFDAGGRIDFVGGYDHMQYFISEFIRVDMIRGLCMATGFDKSNPENILAFCDIHGNREVGDKLKEMMKLGASQKWTVALGKVTGNENGLDSSALMDYYKPLFEWLKEYNSNNNVEIGWNENTRCH